jgi:hypothetical protein
MNTEPQTTTKPRRFRFGLRTLLAVVASVTICDILRAVK